MTERDFETNPYSPDERRVAAFIAERTGIGGGDDPIGFLLASYAMIADRCDFVQGELARVEERIADLESRVARDVSL